jgi:3',5'-cyclic AMP phosphodiesterase CpdA
VYLKIIQLSDLHIGKSNNIEKTSRLVDWIINNQDQHQSELILITGDLVDDGANWQFLQAKTEIQRLEDEGYKVLVAPGNHDYGPDGIREKKQSKKDFEDLISQVGDYPHLFIQSGQAFVILDSMAAEIERVDFWGAQGFLGEKQLQLLDKLLDELADNPAVENVILAMHHHPFDYLFYHGLRDHEDLKGVISRRMHEPPRVNVLLFGHKHLDHRFNDPEENKEVLYGIDCIFAAGSTVERNHQGKMIIPVIDLVDKSIQRYPVD